MVVFAVGQATAQMDAGTSSLAPHFIWSGTNHVSPGVWGRMIHLANGAWLLVDTHFARQESTLQLQLSTNHFASWSLVAEVEEAGRYLDNGELLQLADGMILLTGRSVVEGHSYRLPVYRSTDGGRSWAALSHVDASESTTEVLQRRGLWEPYLYLLQDGRVAAVYANEKHSIDQPASSQICAERVSTDGGASWGPEMVLAAQPGGGALRPGMPIVTRMANGRFIAVYEVVGVGDADVFTKISADGVHWPAGLGTKLVGQHAGPWVASLANGDLLVTSCANQLSRSHDFGITWETVTPPAWDFGPGKTFDWPAIYEVGPNQIAVMISHRGVRMRTGVWK